MSWRKRLLIHAGGGYFPGVTLGPWLRMLRRNRVELRPRFCLRAACITAYAFQNTALSWYERARFSPRVEQVKLAAPIFVLGAPRHGTTHLHNLLSIDSRLAAPNVYQVLNPQTFLTTERVVPSLLGFLIPENRPQDNVCFSFQSPHEEEIAMASVSGLSPYLGFVFPDQAAHYHRYFDLRSAPQSELEEWKRCYLWFLKKLTLRYNRRLVLKSPPNTSRISLLLEMFPSAKFVHIARHPFDVYRSSIRTIKIAREWVGLQGGEQVNWDQELLFGYRRLYDRYFQERSLIPDGALHELKFEDLERDPLGELSRLYESLQLGEFTHVENDLRAYSKSLSGYRKNDFAPLEPATKRRVADHWGKNFEEWGYAA